MSENENAQTEADAQAQADNGEENPTNEQIEQAENQTQGTGDDATGDGADSDNADAGADDESGDSSDTHPRRFAAIGRAVLLHEEGKKVARTATIAMVGTGNRINIGALDYDGSRMAMSNIPLVDEDAGDEVPSSGWYCTWPIY